MKFCLQCFSEDDSKINYIKPVKDKDEVNLKPYESKL